MINSNKEKTFLNNKYNDYNLRNKKEIYSIIKNFSTNFIQDFKNNLKNFQEETENDIFNLFIFQEFISNISIQITEHQR